MIQWEKQEDILNFSVLFELKVRSLISCVVFSHHLAASEVQFGSFFHAIIVRGFFIFEQYVLMLQPLP